MYLPFSLPEYFSSIYSILLSIFSSEIGGRFCLFSLHLWETALIMCLSHLGMFNIHKCLILKCDRQPCILLLCYGAIHNRGWTSSFLTLPLLPTFLLVAALCNQFLFLPAHCINPVLCSEEQGWHRLLLCAPCHSNSLVH